MEWLFLLLIALVYGAYKLGHKEGIEKINKQQIDIGTWIEVDKPIKHRPTDENKRKTVPVGTMAIVTGKDKWYRLNVWIAHPWARHWGHPQLYDITEFDKIRIVPYSKISEDIRKPTFEALAEWEDFQVEMFRVLFKQEE